MGFHLAKFDYWMHFDQGIGPQIVRAGIQIGACAYGGPGGCVAASAAMSTWLSGDLKQGLKAAIITTVSLSVSGAIGDAGMTMTQTAIAHGAAQGTLAVVGQGRFTLRSFFSFPRSCVGMHTELNKRVEIVANVVRLANIVPLSKHPNFDAWMLRLRAA